MINYAPHSDQFIHYTNFSTSSFEEICAFLSILVIELGRWTRFIRVGGPLDDAIEYCHRACPGGNLSRPKNHVCANLEILSLRGRVKYALRS